MLPFRQHPMLSGLQLNNDDGNNAVLQWPMNQAEYKNVSSDEIDWAALAQQWIHMKESYPEDNTIPSAPPPPNISSLRDFDEKGEAEMEVEKEDEPIPSLLTIQTSRGDDFTNQQDVNWQQSGGWNTHWRKKPGWNTWTNPNVQQTQSFRQPLLPDPTNTCSKTSSMTRWPNFSNSNSDQSGSLEKNKAPLNIENFPTPLDAAKRKTLPAWIRQGLEKMEREKQKTAEKKQPKENSEFSHHSIRFDEKLSPKQFSAFDTESESDECEDRKLPLLSGSILIPYKPPARKSRLEKLQELMCCVRSVLTAILLDVTNEEIRNIATESLSKIRSKARTAQTVSKSALTSLTGGLGLGIYADSDNSESTSEENNANESCDSEAELQELLKRRKTSFEIKEREIEVSLREGEEKEKQWLEEDDEEEAEGFDKNTQIVSHTKHKETGEIQQEKIKASHGRIKEKKASRFSDANDIVKNIYTHGSLIYEKVSNPQNKIDVQEVPSKSNLYANNRDSDTSSDSSEISVYHRPTRSSKADNSSDDSDDLHSYKRSKYLKKRRSSSHERSHSSYKKPSRSSKHSYYADKERERSGSRDRGSRSSYSSSKYKSRSRSDSRDRRSHYRH